MDTNTVVTPLITNWMPITAVIWSVRTEIAAKMTPPAIWKAGTVMPKNAKMAMLSTGGKGG